MVAEAGGWLVSRSGQQHLSTHPRDAMPGQGPHLPSESADKTKIWYPQLRELHFTSCRILNSATWRRLFPFTHTVDFRGGKQEKNEFKETGNLIRD